MRLLSQLTKQNYLYKIRLHYSTYVYNCGMLNENMTKLLLALDGVFSYGNSDIKQKRKSLVNRIQHFQNYLTQLIVRKSLSLLIARRNHGIYRNGL